MIQLSWHPYKYFPYEREIAIRELTAVLGVEPFAVGDEGVSLNASVDMRKASLLTYFSAFEDEKGSTRTLQSHLEAGNRNGNARQSTRYSVHGMHEYKGKFNPQIARAVLNLFGATDGTRVLDPFCGSGTTLVECAHLRATGVGTDINPLAVFIANAKLKTLSIPASRLLATMKAILNAAPLSRLAFDNDEREAYLRSWFDGDNFLAIENLRRAIISTAGEEAPFFLVIASNLLRDYSLQEPGDLRIRRRFSPLPDLSLNEAFRAAVEKAVEKLASAQEVVGEVITRTRATLSDSRSVTASEGLFDCALTSPPYAMALPYIDTQRLSIVWLGMCSPKGIGPLDASLVGSREIRKKDATALESEIIDNERDLPLEQAGLCRTLHLGLGTGDGFRRKAVPALLYRYFDAMRANFAAVHQAVRSGGRYALIVGHNSTTIGGVRYDINTPKHLGSLATQVGWRVDELIELQAYQRYGLHASNGITSETLMMLRK